MKINISHNANQEFIAQNQNGVKLNVGCCDKNTLFTPMELLLVGLASCSSVDIVEVFSKKRFEIEHYSVDVSASRVTSVPAIFETITVTYNIDSEVKKQDLINVLDLCISKYCSVADIISPTATIISKIKYNGEVFDI